MLQLSAGSLTFYLLGQGYFFFCRAGLCCHDHCGVQLQKRLLLSQKEKEGVEDELQALKEVKRVLQRELNIVQREKETM